MSQPESNGSERRRWNDPAWTSAWLRRQQVTEAATDQLLAHLEPGPGERVLDVGCGSGPLFAPLAARGVHVTGIDPAPAMVALARNEAARHPGLVVVEERGWETIAERDAYDAALALGVFDYVDDPAELLRRMGGAAPHIVASFPAPGLRLRLRQVRYGRRGVHVHGYRTEDLGRLASAAGLVPAGITPLGRAGYLAHFARAGG